jgi:para-nitrobenzyl esterase
MAMGPVVHLLEGAVRGRATAFGATFLGIPYAREARFEPPAEIGWTGIRDALAPGPAMPQPRRPMATFTHGEPPPQAEGCLTLNVFTPEHRNGPLPVLVWIHGGGFAMGWSTASLYDGARLATAGPMVVVSLNYRLGSLGWLAHPQIGANAGRLDQLAALRWVARNISAFGGDPDRVTVAGQSAGALNVMGLLVAPGAPGLFARAIVQSPPVFDVAHDPALGQEWAEALSAAAGGRAGTFDHAALERLAPHELVALAEELLATPAFAGTRGGALPMLDSATLPVSPADAPQALVDIPVLVGHTHDEATFFFRAGGRTPPPPERLAAVVGHLPGITDAPATIERYRAAGTPEDDLLIRIATDAMIAEPTARWAAQRAAAGGRVHRYRVDHPGPDPRLAAIHTVEVPLVFGTYGDGDAGTRLAGDTPRAAAVSDAVQRTWATFVGGEDPDWDAVAPSGAVPELGVFGGEGEPFRRAPDCTRQ